MKLCCFFKHSYFIYLSQKFYVIFCLNTSLLKNFRMPVKFFQNFNPLFLYKNNFIICNLVRLLWTVELQSYFYLYIKLFLALLFFWISSLLFHESFFSVYPQLSIDISFFCQPLWTASNEMTLLCVGFSEYHLIRGPTTLRGGG